ncbi:acetoacetate--CoA ligase [Hoyosella rhizosphaerae]|uniref:Acetoacetyl-CoA synthetase n=1 Tax=Hoyosella rhizosphaerae TaxID=1755582 RepID=A0A916XD93_9ACTN|nr:acetoacetate--CoA ligase [Hoyosella rhizosphaerae]MBN4927584.1 acetoacetate--CoA ligase [Hoyosella rhizosphaerae]GGC63307.1 acetoacetyl-CoA synthetase [Hoyosella rhizosphaerae]
MTNEPAPMWEPTPDGAARARITDFARFARTSGAPQDSYDELLRWSVDNPESFWGSLWRYFDLGEIPGPVLASRTMPGAQWFPGVRLNYANVVMRRPQAERPAILALSEDSPAKHISWDQVQRDTAALAATLREAGVKPGDRVVGYLPNIPEAIIAFLATASLGAVWAACGQDYSAPAAVARLAQLNPVVLIAADGYRYGGKVHDKRPTVEELSAALTSITATILVPNIGADSTSADKQAEGTRDGVMDWAAAIANEAEWAPTDVPFDHPLWVVFSSGTTGLPKGIVHGHGGVAIEHLKQVGLHLDLGVDDTFFWFTSPSWMMWNFLIAGLMVGSTVVTYDGSPASPHIDAVWKLAADHRVTVVGTSPGYVLSCAKAERSPRHDHDLSALRAVGITGATLPESSAWWMHRHVGEDVQICSISGGTDVVSAFVGPSPITPVWAGEITRPCLGVALDSFDTSGNSVRNGVGELVITAPMPSMPVAFWNDPDGSKYLDAYFDTYPGIWRHGDWISITDHGTILMHGRSDSTLNRHGVRMGSADIYQVVEQIPDVFEALILGVELPDGEYWMPLFVHLADEVELTDEVQHRIVSAIREQLSPRHVPDEIIAAPAIPHTRTGKKLEVPLKKILQGGDPGRAVDRSAVDSPELVDWFAQFRR